MEILDCDRQGWLSRGKILANLGKHKAALTCYEQAMKIKPKYYKAWSEIDFMLELVGCLEAAENCFDRALGKFDGKDEKIANFAEHQQQIPIPGASIASTCYNQACFQALQGNIDRAIAYLQQALTLDRNKYREMSRQDSDFDNIRGNKLFQEVVENYFIAN
ncbi:tetratricopeptide repeat protein [Pleurocapsa sp. PCC 7319]|uniref:TPR end-of-group domain-containing protein n=1 Tax=Pleurocapsa sp. PCC 7319 TaxID=118161 RepID=UPI00034B4FF2|nr:tetratricopeptide repeat protein [Pleurocapsa sp. PCC 7319]